MTVLIAVFVYFFVFGSRTFAYCATRTFIFLLFPLVLSVLTFCLPIFVSVGSEPVSYFRFEVADWYLPPVGFLLILALCITTMFLVLSGWFKNLSTESFISAGFSIV